MRVVLDTNVMIVLMIAALEQTRVKVSKTTEAKKKSQLGQFFTPARIAQFMVGLFSPPIDRQCRVLDAGAGIGSLSCAFLGRCLADDFKFAKIELAAFELDDGLHGHLSHALSRYAEQVPLELQIFGGDFIEAAVNRIQFGQGDFTHAILNPPYKKISSNSRHRLLLRELGIETVNLYSAFVALALSLMAPGGQVVAIIPRSFCNGPYYRPFRDFLLERASILRLHLFESRSKAFHDDGVLQENLIVQLECGGQQGSVTVSTSTDDTFIDLASHEYPFDQIVFPGDSERFIHVPTSPGQNTIELTPAICYLLTDLGVQVSTGPVVDFRLKEHLCERPEPGAVPLLYPGHFSKTGIEWPKPSLKKPSVIRRNAETEKWLYPNGFYCVVRRFSSKEEKRRIMARVVDPASFNFAPMLGFENHLNVFHDNKRGLPKALAHGLAAFLNTTAVDESFRRFNGHTQVNATDLKQMKYPSRKALFDFGEWAMQSGNSTQAKIDEKLGMLAHERN